MTNILRAIVNIIETNVFDVKTLYTGDNRINSVGEALEKYIKDAFANTLLETDEQSRLQKYAETFSWLGAKNSPPDIIIKNGDAIEVKKISSATTSIALNNSYLKAVLEKDSPMIDNACRNCEDWTVKDLIYCVGHVQQEKLQSLWMFYGNVYSAHKNTYERIKNVISHGIAEIPDVTFSPTNELGRVNNVDPLGITSLRIRGMWQIASPKKVFSYLFPSQKQKSHHKFECIVIIPLDKYNSFPLKHRNKLENIQHTGLKIVDKNVKNPNNPSKLIACKLITFNTLESNENG